MSVCNSFSEVRQPAQWDWFKPLSAPTQQAFLMINIQISTTHSWHRIRISSRWIKQAHVVDSRLYKERNSSQVCISCNCTLAALATPGLGAGLGRSSIQSLTPTPPGHEESVPHYYLVATQVLCYIFSGYWAFNSFNIYLRRLPSCFILWITKNLNHLINGWRRELTLERSPKSENLILPFLLK